MSAIAESAHKLPHITMKGITIVIIIIITTIIIINYYNY